MSIACSPHLFIGPVRPRLRSPLSIVGGGGIGGLRDPFPGFLHNKKHVQRRSADLCAARGTLEPAETATTPVGDRRAPDVQTTPPWLAEPEMLVKGLRYLQERIPEFTQLSVQEKRRMPVRRTSIRSSSKTACTRPASGGTRRLMVKRSGEELRQEHEEITGGPRSSANCGRSPTGSRRRT